MLVNDLAKAGVDQLVNAVDNVSRNALEALGDLENAAVLAGHGVINVGDATFDEALAQVEAVRAELVESLKALSKVATEAFKQPE